MRITRRSLMAATGAAALAGSVLPRRVWAETALDLGGGASLTTLSDGNLVLPGDFILGGMPQAEMTDIVTRYGLSTDQLTPPCNVTLYRDGTNTVLFDVGSGPDFMPSAGKITEAMDAIGLAPEEVTHVIFTHAHPDHIWGLLDEFDEPLFYEAAYHIGRQEWEYWTDPATVDTIGLERQSFAVGAARRLAVLEDSINLFEDATEILPGIASVASFGHTPGHMAFDVGGKVLVGGDAIGNHHVAFERPQWPSGSDQDPEMGAATRVALLDRIVADDLTLVGFHLPGGGIGRVERATDGYRYVEDL
ncbi:MAG: MBL fold metallo-hydrolase [Rhodobacteraceae bacterium]|nr:MBL fold metallo-hydrolase [Paracoccaceae bacterium]